MSDIKYGITEQLHPDTADLVNRFSTALASKLLAAQKKYGYTNGWKRAEWERECRAQMYEHVIKGDPLDVAAFCAFMWHHRWGTWSQNEVRVGVAKDEPPTDGVRVEEGTSNG